jgi:hypothetical protein
MGSGKSPKKAKAYPSAQRTRRRRMLSFLKQQKDVFSAYSAVSEPAPDIDPRVSGSFGGPARRWNNAEAKDLHCE